MTKGITNKQLKRIKDLLKEKKIRHTEGTFVLEGYKVNNHICLGYYLRDVLERNDLFRLFDDCRFKRNSLVYYGKQMDFDIAKEAIDNCIKLIEKIRLLIKF